MRLDFQPIQRPLSVPPIPLDTPLNEMRTTIRERFAPKTQARAASISAMAKIDGLDLMTATIRYDFEDAPVTNNAEMLLHVNALPGFIPGVTPSTKTLNHLINALASINVFLINTNYFSDAELIHVLWTQVCTEPVRFLPPSEGACEIIDLFPRRPLARLDTVSDRDATLPTANALIEESTS